MSKRLAEWVGRVSPKGVPRQIGDSICGQVSGYAALTRPTGNLPRPLAEIDAELEAVERRIVGTLREVME